MATYDLLAVVSGLDVEDEEQVDRLFTERFVLLPADRDGVTTLSLEIDAESGEEALKVFMEHMAGVPEVHVERIDEDLVNTSEIAARLDVSRETPRLWASRDHTQVPPFPGHHTIVGSPGKPQRLWRWVEVFEWVRARGQAGTSHLGTPLDASLVTLFNAQLLASRAARAAVTASGESAREVSITG